MSISIITAFDNNRVIGNKNQLPWSIPEDLKHFKEVTSGHTVVMGRKTYESIGRPLPRRKNIVLTRDKEFHADGVETFHSIDQVLNLEEDIFIIGGSEIYKAFLPYADSLHITMIHNTFDGDTFFPMFDAADKFDVVKCEECIDDKGLEYSFMLLEKKKKRNILEQLFPELEFIWTNDKEKNKGEDK